MKKIDAITEKLLMISVGLVVFIVGWVCACLVWHVGEIILASVSTILGIWVMVLGCIRLGIR